MKLLFKSVLAIILSCSSIQAQDIVGQWNGVLSVNGINLRLIFHIEKNDEGYTSTMDSPDQGRTGFPVQTTSFDGSKLLLDLPSVGAKYEGEFQIDSIVGTLIQNGMSFSINALTPGFCRPIALSIPPGVSATLGGLLPSFGFRQMPFVVIAPIADSE
jgi:hypothetical protein